MKKDKAVPSQGSRLMMNSANMNMKEHIQYYNRLTELSISMFEWDNLPETVDARYLELALFSDGQCIFFEDEVLGKLALKCMIGGPLDVYQVPTKRKAYAVNGYQRELTKDNSVIIWNNLIRTPSSLDVEVYAKKLYNIDRAIEVNANAQKTPVLIKCDEKQRLTMLNLYKKYDGNEPFIFGDKSLNTSDSFTVLNTGSPYVADKLYELKTQIWNEALTYLGISNLNMQKKERLVSDEVARNVGSVIASRYSRLVARQNACEQINKMFGTNISVHYRPDYREMDDEYMLDIGKDDIVPTPMVNDLKTRSSYE